MTNEKEKENKADTCALSAGTTAGADTDCVKRKILLVSDERKRAEKNDVLSELHTSSVHFSSHH